MVGPARSPKRTGRMLEWEQFAVAQIVDEQSFVFFGFRLHKQFAAVGRPVQWQSRPYARGQGQVATFIRARVPEEGLKRAAGG